MVRVDSTRQSSNGICSMMSGSHGLLGLLCVGQRLAHGHVALRRPGTTQFCEIWPSSRPLLESRTTLCWFCALRFPSAKPCTPEYCVVRGERTPAIVPLPFLGQPIPDGDNTHLKRSN